MEIYFDKSLDDVIFYEQVPTSKQARKQVLKQALQHCETLLEKCPDLLGAELLFRGRAEMLTSALLEHAFTAGETTISLNTLRTYIKSSDHLLAIANINTDYKESSIRYFMASLPGISKTESGILCFNDDSGLRQLEFVQSLADRLILQILEDGIKGWHNTDMKLEAIKTEIRRNTGTYRIAALPHDKKRAT